MDESLKEIGALARDGEIARQREAAPDPRRGTVDRDDDGNVEIGEREQHRVVMTAQRVAAPRPAADRTTRRSIARQLGPRTKAAPFAGDPTRARAEAGPMAEGRARQAGARQSRVG